MTFVVDHQQFFKDCVDFTVRRNIGAVRKKAARLVSIASLQQFVEQKYGDQCSYYFTHLKGLDDYIKTRGKMLRSSVPCGDWKRWDFELMYSKDYYSDSRFVYRYFPELVENTASNTLLFICYSEENHQSYLEDTRLNRKIMDRDQELSREIMNLYRELKPTQAMIDDRRSLKNRIQHRLNQVWPEMNLKVAVFGSSASGLVFKDADLDLCVVVPEARYKEDWAQYKFKMFQLPNSVYNMNCIASVLRSMGMKDVYPICGASVPICKFFDPKTGFRCDINTNNTLGIVNTKLIQQYMDTDPRVTPLLFAIKYFVKQKNINNPSNGTLSSYAYIIMAIHYLITHRDGPVVPCLQNLPVPCTSKVCNWKTSQPVVAVYDRQLQKFAVNYHNCIAMKSLIHSPNYTAVWKSPNAAELGTLLLGFFNYYWQSSNIAVSIISGGKDLPGYSFKKGRDNGIIVQDPFLRKKNVAHTCRRKENLELILEEFFRASKLLSHGYSFEYVCRKDQNFVDHPITTMFVRNMEYSETIAMKEIPLPATEVQPKPQTTILQKENSTHTLQTSTSTNKQTNSTSTVKHTDTLRSESSTKKQTAQNESSTKKRAENTPKDNKKPKQKEEKKQKLEWKGNQREIEVGASLARLSKGLLQIKRDPKYSPMELATELNITNAHYDDLIHLISRLFLVGHYISVNYDTGDRFKQGDELITQEDILNSNGDMMEFLMHHFEKFMRVHIAVNSSAIKAEEEENGFQMTSHINAGPQEDHRELDGHNAMNINGRTKHGNGSVTFLGTNRIVPDSRQRETIRAEVQLPQSKKLRNTKSSSLQENGKINHDEAKFSERHDSNRKSEKQPKLGSSFSEKHELADHSIYTQVASSPNQKNLHNGSKRSHDDEISALTKEFMSYLGYMDCAPNVKPASPDRPNRQASLPSTANSSATAAEIPIQRHFSKVEGFPKQNNCYSKHSGSYSDDGYDDYEEYDNYENYENYAIYDGFEKHVFGEKADDCYNMGAEEEGNSNVEILISQLQALQNGQYEERVDIQAQIRNVPLEVEAYQIISCLQWVAEVNSATMASAVNNKAIWRVQLNVQRKNLHLLNRPIDFGDFTATIQIL